MHQGNRRRFISRMDCISLQNRGLVFYDSSPWTEVLRYTSATVMVVLRDPLAYSVLKMGNDVCGSLLGVEASLCLIPFTSYWWVRMAYSELAKRRKLDQCAFAPVLA